MRQREPEFDDTIVGRRAAPHERADKAGDVPRQLRAERGPLSRDDVLRLQRLAGNSSVSGLLTEDGEERSPVTEVVGSGGGRPLEDDVRADMEARLGHDFRDVRLHTDARAAESARAVDAYAYTAGSDVVFQTDRYQPHSPEGRRMLAHELTHVVQQRSGPVDGTPAPGGIRVSDPSDRFEREAAATADQVLAPAADHAPGPAAGATVQRQAEGAVEEEEEQPLQALAVQREGAPEEEEEEPAEPSGS
jgi:Domain of unknown function (DUF4157)